MIVLSISKPILLSIIKFHNFLNEKSLDINIRNHMFTALNWKQKEYLIH